MIGAINAIKGIGPYQTISKINLQRMAKAHAAQQSTQAAQTAQSAKSGMQWKLSGESTLPVQPVRAIGAPAAHSAETMDPAQKLEQGADPVEMAVRMRIQQPEAEEAIPVNALGQEEEVQFNMIGQEEENSVKLPGQKEETEFNLVGQEEEEPAMRLPGQKEEPANPIEKEQAEQAEKTEESEETKDPQDVMEEAECQTCERRQYQDGSNDPGVSFKTPTRIAPEAVASAVRGHEMEHVVRERAAAAREDKEVVSQSVTIHSGICPECGDVYVSGGTTRTTTAQKPPQQDTAEWVKRANHFSIVV